MSSAGEVSLVDLDVEELERELDKYAQDPAIAAALKDGKALHQYTQQVDKELRGLEHESVDEYLKCQGDLLSLHTDIQLCDSVLEKMEAMLTNFQSDLGGISRKIKRLQQDSLDMNGKLQNRRVAAEVLNTYLSHIVVTPDLVHAICEGEVDDHYIGRLNDLTNKLEHATQPGLAEHPSSAASIPELERLKTKAISRIRDFLISKINQLKKPKTNVQIIQRNVLVRFKPLYTFLTDHHPSAAHDVQQLYVHTMQRLYLTQFKTYVQSLSRLQLEQTATRNDLLGAMDSGGAAMQAGGAGGVGQMLGAVMGLNRSHNILQGRGNVFSLAGRDQLLRELDANPLVAHTIHFTPPSTSSASSAAAGPAAAAADATQAPSSPTPLPAGVQGTASLHAQQSATSKFYSEQLFRSHQKLLVDTATAEFLFLHDFFSTPGGGRDDLAVFNDVFSKTFQFFYETLEGSISTSYDSVGLLLMARVNEWNRLTMQRRRVPCLEGYLDRLRSMLWPRFKQVVDMNVLSLRRAPIQQMLQLPPAQKTHPHYVTRRYAEMSSALSALSTPIGGGTPDDTLTHSLTAMQNAMETLLEAMAREFSSRRDRLIFLINNYDLILGVLHEKKLQNEAAGRFDCLLRDQISVYVEEQLLDYFSELIRFVKETEPKLNAAAPGTAPGTAPATMVDPKRVERIVKSFGAEWKRSIDAIHANVLSSFTNFTNGMDILKQVLTQLLLYNTRFQKLFGRIYPSQGGQQTPLVKELVANTTILSEFRQYTTLK